jgi:hypothetical protein
MMKIIIVLIALMFTVSAENGHDHDKHEGHGKKGPNGGELLEVGKEVAEIEILHDEKSGTVKLFIFKEGAKEKLVLEKAPRLNLTLNSGRKQLRTKAIDGAEKSHSFSITDNLLKGHIELTVSLEVNGKTYSVKVDHDH